ncbi:Cytochrome P450, E-class, group IV [Lasallia pustulata]|uniref:Cytochrome P450, E-class, group IV n=1 Tax=Lasallia pustulata TaxID=136370 RepID=A0A1W5CTW0_9LECA|nr:Cytochrome P450, E-class, group IV [Lasallia pustulata]
MDGPFSAITILVLAAIIGLWYILDYLYAPRHSSGEPPVLPSSVPYVGHIIGLLRHGTRYYQTTSAKCKHPIYTLNMLNGKVYIVTSPDLVSAVNRNSKSLAFNPFIAQLGKRITGHDDATSQIVQHNLNGEQGSGYVIEVHDGLVAALSPGAHLESMIAPMLQKASTYIDDLDCSNEVDLFAWMRRMVTMCSTTAIYGPDNPFAKNSDYTDFFWDFDHDLNLLIIDVFPTLTAPKGSRARSILGTEFQQYFENYKPGQTQSSAMIQARHAANTKHGVSLWNQGRLEVGTLLGILANTIPSAFYMLVHIYSDPSLLKDIRAELETTAVSTAPPDAKRTLCILTLRDKCHLLHSTFQEMLRVHAHGAGSRFVREDTILDDQYLLKKGMVIQMPMAVMHSDPSIWGPDVASFQPRRFLKPNEASKGLKANSPAYRPFGGGASMCPGRHFVALEVLALTACMVLRFDIMPVVGEWSVPPQRQESLATNVFPPEKDVRVKVTRRAGFEAVVWDFAMK